MPPHQGAASMRRQLSCLQAFGNLNNGGNAGLWYLNGNRRLSNTRWNNASRLSGCK